MKMERASTFSIGIYRVRRLSRATSAAYQRERIFLHVPKMRRTSSSIAAGLFSARVRG